MLHLLKLTYFRQHESLDIEFQEGMNVIRGRNEAGKSTIIEAICYAMFGLRGVEVTLADLVTYGRRESDLKVELWLTLGGERIYVKRSKSGSELMVEGSETRVTGQSEVTKYVEHLLGVTTQLAPKIVMAKQNKIRGAIEEGSEAVKLIERLSNLGLIDTLLGLIQTTLPNGSTALHDQLIEQLGKETSASLEDRTEELKWKMEELENQVLVAQQAVERYRASMLDAVDVTRRHERLISHKSQVNVLLDNVGLQKMIVDRGLPEDGDKVKVAEWQAAVANAKHLQSVWYGYTKLTKNLPQTMKGSVEAFKSQYMQVQQIAISLLAQVNEARTNLAITKLGVMPSQTCQWCSQDVSQLPLYKDRNEQNKLELDKCIELVAGLERRHFEATEAQGHLKQLIDADGMIRLYADTFPTYVQFTEGTCPVLSTWIGPDPTQPAEDYTDLIRAEQIKLESFARAATARGISMTELDKLQRRLTELGPVDEDAIKACEEEVKELSVQKQRLSVLNLQYLDTVPHFRVACDEYTAEKARIAAVSARRYKDLVQLDTAKAAVAELKFHNQLVKKLKMAKPVIADQLWSAVTAVVGDYFGEIRGAVSVVEKSDEGFTVDGKPVLNNLSGSTLDALGLAVRMGLTKTFLPNTRFLVLDEVAAGMDDQREGAMLGLLASFGMDQTIVITHSALADSFANNVILLENNDAND